MVPKNIPFMAVTATATRKTKDTITSVLRLGKFVQVSESPNKPKQNSLTQYFQWILDEKKGVQQNEQSYTDKR